MKSEFFFLILCRSFSTWIYNNYFVYRDKCLAYCWALGSVLRNCKPEPLISQLWQIHEFALAIFHFLYKIPTPEWITVGVIDINLSLNSTRLLGTHCMPDSPKGSRNTKISRMQFQLLDLLFKCCSKGEGKPENGNRSKIKCFLRTNVLPNL